MILFLGTLDWFNPGVVFLTQESILPFTFSDSIVGILSKSYNMFHMKD